MFIETYFLDVKQLLLDDSLHVLEFSSRKEFDGNASLAIYRIFCY